ncbi:hypothetical protein CDAR_105451 [Caerostris darwini]|uniref:Uncharacterized protein n=1 Tax=Caerostris darwini TaxID=1538125 RepID=A0AAV4N1I4_9ARAC|nr:hypothetical protein CDAR_105451 [Caerostris darwini]
MKHYVFKVPGEEETNPNMEWKMIEVESKISFFFAEHFEDMMLHCLLAHSLPETHSNKPEQNNLLKQQQETPEGKKIHLPFKFDQFGSGKRFF